MSLAHSETQCIFCKIANGTIPTRKIYEDDEFIAFHDIRPAAPIHFLIIPKQHIVSLAECHETHQALLGRMMLLAPQLALEQGCQNGFRVITNSGVDGGQEVFHLHLHVMGGPRPWH